MKHKLKRLFSTGDSHFSEIIKHSLWALIILGFATGIQFVFDFLMARSFGADGTGIFYLCFSVVIGLSLLGHLGLDRTSVKLIPPLLTKKDFASAQAVKKASVHLVLINTLFISACLFIIAPWLANSIFHNNELVTYLRIFSLAIPAYSLRYLYGGILRALKQTKEALIVERVVIYAFGILAIFSIGKMLNIKGMAIGFVISCIISLLIGMYFTNKYLPREAKSRTFSKKILLASGIPLLFVAFATQMNGQASVIILGSFGSTTDVGIYNAALKISLLLALVLTAINAIAGTTISELHAKGDKKQMEIIFGKTSALGFLLALPLFLIMFIFPEFLLGIFGSEFVPGSSALIILAIGQLVNITVGPTLFILAMTGHEKALAKAVGASLVINVVLGLLIIPHLKVFGAGLSTAIAITISNIIMLILVKHYLDIWSLPFKHLGQWIKKTLGLAKL